MRPQPLNIYGMRRYNEDYVHIDELNIRLDAAVAWLKQWIEEDSEIPWLCRDELIEKIDEAFGTAASPRKSVESKEGK